MVRLPECVDKAKNANIPHDAFSLFISNDILNVILTHTNQKVYDYLFSFTGKVQKWMRRTSLDELRTVIGLLIYGGVFESLHEQKESLYKMDGTGRLVFPAVDMLHQMCVRYTVEQATRRWTIVMFFDMINIAAVNALVIYANNMAKLSLRRR